MVSHFEQTGHQHCECNPYVCCCCSFQATMSGAIEIMTNEVDEWCQKLGWRDTTISFGDGIALLHSEVSEALEAYRTRKFEAWEDNGKPQGVGSEYADILIRLLDECSKWGIDLYGEYRRKMAYNWLRPYRHGGKEL